MGNCHQAASATPSKVPCAKASAKNAMRRHKTKHPKGADSRAKILPAIQAGAIMANQAVIRSVRKIFIRKVSAVYRSGNAGFNEFDVSYFRFSSSLFLVIIVIARLVHDARKHVADAHMAAHNDDQIAFETQSS